MGSIRRPSSETAPSQPGERAGYLRATPQAPNQKALNPEAEIAQPSTPFEKHRMRLSAEKEGEQGSRGGSTDDLVPAGPASEPPVSSARKRLAFGED